MLLHQRRSSFEESQLRLQHRPKRNHVAKGSRLTHTAICSITCRLTYASFSTFSAVPPTGQPCLRTNNWLMKCTSESLSVRHSIELFGEPANYSFTADDFCSSASFECCLVSHKTLNQPHRSRCGRDIPAVNRSDHPSRAMTTFLRPRITTDPLRRLARATAMSQPYRPQRTPPRYRMACPVSQSALGQHEEMYSLVEPCIRA